MSNQEQEKQITEEYVDNYLEEKLEIDKNCIVCKYFDLKVIKDLSDKQVDDFLRIAREKLLKKGYEVEIIDAWLNEYEVEDVFKKIIQEKDKILFVGISSYMSNTIPTIELINKIKSK